MQSSMPQHHQIIVSPTPDERPHKREYFADELYYRFCTPMNEGLDEYTCSEDQKVEDAWKKAVYCGRFSGQVHTAIDKVWNKALGDVEELTGDLDEIACVSSTTLFNMGIHICPNYETTADVIQAHNILLNLGLNNTQVLDLAEKHVSTRIENFNATRDCGLYEPKIIEGTELGPCYRPFVPSTDEPFAVDENNYPNTPLLELYEFLKLTLMECASYDHELKYFEGVNVNWNSEEPFYTFTAEYYDLKTEQKYVLQISGDWEHGIVRGEDDEDEIYIPFDFSELCPHPWPVEDSDSELTIQIKSFYNRHPVEMFDGYECDYNVTNGNVIEEFIFVPTDYLALYRRTEDGEEVETFISFDIPDN